MNRSTFHGMNDEYISIFIQQIDKFKWFSAFIDTDDEKFIINSETT